MEDYTEAPAGPETADGASARLIDTVKELLSSALSSDPGNTSVDLGGCYISPLIDLLHAVEAGTAGAALYPLVREVVAMEESLASRARDVDSGSAAINPVRVIGSLRELENLASDSIVCSPWAPSSVYQTDSESRWYEPGSEETLPAGAVWELMTGSDSGIVMDEDRRVWVLYDAGSPVPKPGPASDHGYLTMANAGRAERFITHPTLSEARSVIEALCSQPGGAPAFLAIRYRAGGDSVFRGITPVSPGTTPGQLPWKQADS